jgi:SpoIIAA-like
MISHRLLRDEGILIVSPTAPLEASDFKEVASEVDPFIEENGSLKGLLVDAQAFSGWRDFGGLVSHFRFIRDQHDQIKKIAAVSDSELLSILRWIAAHFVSAEIKHFATGDKAAAMEWLKAP